MKVKLMTLCENTASKSGIAATWGWSIFIETNDINILFDTGDGMAAVRNADKGLVIVLGYAHRGIINTIRHAQTLTGENTVHTVMGGTHLYPKKDEQINKTTHALKELDAQNIGVSHCTGFKAAMKLAAAFGDKFFLNTAGCVRAIE